MFTLLFSAFIACGEKDVEDTATEDTAVEESQNVEDTAESEDTASE